jgi:nuclear pore complex protein Nup98-Nup96
LGSSAQNQPNQGSGLFGNNANQTKPGGFFSSLNTSSTNPNPGFGGLGASTNNQQQAGGGAAPSLTGQTGFSFGNSQQNQAQGQQSAALTASIADIDPFGNFQLFNSSGQAVNRDIGPLVTPLSSSQKLKKSTILPQYKMNPASSTRMITPQRRGFGFSYSTYGTPGSVSSTSTPLGLGTSSLGTGFGRTLGKSLSMSNLGRTYEADESLLAPGAFSATGSRQYNTGSLRKLVINRGLRSDLFASPSPTHRIESTGALPAEPAERSQASGSGKKRVTFDAETVGGNGHENDGHNIFGNANGTSPTPAAEEQGLLRTPSARSNGVPETPSVGGSSNSSGSGSGSRAGASNVQIRGNELAVVPENGSPMTPDDSPMPGSANSSFPDKQSGDYWMSPTKEEVRKLPRDKQKQLSGFKVGRHGCGTIEFLEPVDLTSVDLDNIFGNIVRIETRTCTVYPDTSQTPEVGKGLNVPSRIALENSWPRIRNKQALDAKNPRVQKHIIRLQRIKGTKFESYNPETGVWIFKVDHFTTYGMDDDEDDDDTGVEGDGLTTNGASSSSVQPYYPQAGRGTEAGRSNSSANVMMTLNGSESHESASQLNDTFDFMRPRAVPGAFDDLDGTEYDGRSSGRSSRLGESAGEHFLDERSMGSNSEAAGDEPVEVDDHDASAAQNESVIVADTEMAESYPQPDHTMEHEDALTADDTEKNGWEFLASPKANLNMALAESQNGTPLRAQLLQLDDDWAQQLRRTISPRKQDRHALRYAQDEVLLDLSEDNDDTPLARSEGGASGRGFYTSIDLMKSLFGPKEEQRNRGKSGGRAGKSGYEV